MIAKFKFAYGKIQDWNWEKKEGVLRIPQEAYESLKKLLPKLPNDPTKEHIDHDDHIGNVRLIMRIIGPEAIQIMHIFDSGEPSEFERLFNRVEELSAKVSDRAFNERCRVQVPGLGLLAMDEVKLLEDCCTDVLQTKLEDGWRMIAVCPQPDQRRPDYIIGRSR